MSTKKFRIKERMIILSLMMMVLGTKILEVKFGSMRMSIPKVTERKRGKSPKR
jgi:hypothetical protein